jgi:hypothetical protein
MSNYFAFLKKVERSFTQHMRVLMPLIHIYYPQREGNVALSLEKLTESISAATGIPEERVWAFCHATDEVLARHPLWRDTATPAPFAQIFCRRSHSRACVENMVAALRESLAAMVSCDADKVFMQVIRVDDEDVFHVN